MFDEYLFNSVATVVTFRTVGRVNLCFRRHLTDILQNTKCMTHLIQLQVRPPTTSPGISSCVAQKLLRMPCLAETFTLHEAEPSFRSLHSLS